MIQYKLCLLVSFSEGWKWGCMDRPERIDLPDNADRLPAGHRGPDGRADAHVHKQRGQRRHRHALPAQRLPPGNPWRLRLHRQHGTLRGVKETAHAAAEPGEGGGCVLHPTRARIRDPQTHAGRRVHQQGGDAFGLGWADGVRYRGATMCSCACWTLQIGHIIIIIIIIRIFLVFV